jgi:hypothetical protein
MNRSTKGSRKSEFASDCGSFRPPGQMRRFLNAGVARRNPNYLAGRCKKIPASVLERTLAGQLVIADSISYLGCRLLAKP